MPVKILKLDEIEPKEILGGPIKVMFNPETVGSRYLRFSVGYFGPGEGLNMHIHPESEEVYHVIEGRGTVYIGEEKSPTEIDRNTAIYLPPGTIHGVKNTGRERFIVAFSVAPGREQSKEMRL